MFAVAAGLLAPAVARAQADLWYELRLRVRSFQADADLWAGARLRMSESVEEDGRRVLELVEPLEDAWKLYRISPLLGRNELKHAAELTLPEGSWSARLSAESRAEELARQRYEVWRRQWGIVQEFDQAFSFFIIGAPARRFSVRVHEDGATREVQNRLTHRWLPTGFPDWLAGAAEEGYGFWADDARPPHWEPHGYHALASALELLDTSPLKDGSPGATLALAAGERYRVHVPSVPERTRAVLETLHPPARGRFRGRGEGELDLVVVEVKKGGVRLRGRSGWRAAQEGGGLEYRLSRRARVSLPEGLVGDEVEVELRRGRDAELRLVVGWGSP